MVLISKSKTPICGSFQAEIPDYPLFKLQEVFGFDGWEDIDGKVEYLWDLDLIDGDNVYHFYVYDYYGCRWHIGGNNSLEVVNLIKRTLIGLLS